jgi:hypothetical protein
MAKIKRSQLPPEVIEALRKAKHILLAELPKVDESEADPTFVQTYGHIIGEIEHLQGFIE